MKKTLYDLLEVSQKASPEAIRSAFERLSAKFDPDLPGNLGKSEVLTQYNLIKDAFFTLGNAEKRRQYDLSLKQVVEVTRDPEPVGFWTWGKALPLCLVIVVGSGYALHHRSEQAKIRAALEYEQMVLKQKEMEIQSRMEVERLRFEREKESMAQREAARQRAELESARQYGDRVYRERELSEMGKQQAEQRKKMEEQYRQEERERRAAAERRDAEYRARRETMELESKVRSADYERNRGGAGVSVVGTRR